MRFRSKEVHAAESLDTTGRPCAPLRLHRSSPDRLPRRNIATASSYLKNKCLAIAVERSTIILALEIKVADFDIFLRFVRIPDLELLHATNSISFVQSRGIFCLVQCGSAVRMVLCIILRRAEVGHDLLAGALRTIPGPRLEYGLTRVFLGAGRRLVRRNLRRIRPPAARQSWKAGARASTEYSELPSRLFYLGLPKRTPANSRCCQCLTNRKGRE